MAMSYGDKNSDQRVAMSMIFGESCPVRKVAEDLGVSRSTIYRWIRLERAMLDTASDWVFNSIALPGRDNYFDVVARLDGQLAEKCWEISEYLHALGSPVSSRYVGCTVVSISETGVLAISVKRYERLDSDVENSTKAVGPIVGDSRMWPERCPDSELKFYHRANCIFDSYSSSLLWPKPREVWHFMCNMVDDAWDFSGKGSCLSHLYWADDGLSDVQINGHENRAYLATFFTVMLIASDGSPYVAPFSSNGFTFDKINLRDPSMCPVSSNTPRSLEETLVRQGVSLYFDWKLDYLSSGRDVPFNIPLSIARQSAIDFMNLRMEVGLLRSGLEPVGDGNYRVTEFFDWVSRISAQQHEARALTGDLVILLANASPEFELEFTLPIDVRDERAIGKLVASSREGFLPLFRHNEVIGMGTGDSGKGNLRANSLQDGGLITIKIDDQNDDYGPQTIRFLGNGRWQWIFKSRCIFEVDQGVPRFAAERIKKSEFIDTVEFYFRECDSNTLWELVLAISETNYGAICVVDSEAVQAVGQMTVGFRVLPTRVQSEILAPMSAIDGAILLNPSAEIVGFGLILDGQARLGLGDVSRGSRYNASIRYIHQRRREGILAIAVVFSEDGIVNILTPRLIDYLPRYTGSSVAHRGRIDDMNIPDLLQRKLSYDGIFLVGELTTISKDVFSEYYGTEEVALLESELRKYNLSFFEGISDS